MTEFKFLKYTKKESIGTLILNNPKALNALNMEMLKEFHTCLNELKIDRSLKVLVVTGEGKAFVAGADIKELQKMNSQQAQEYSMTGNLAFRVLEIFPIPVIAAVNGFALGGGLELALCADFIYASRNAKFGLPELSLGLIPGFGGCKRLPERIGLPLAKELLFSGRIISADEALKLGIINQVTEPEELIPAVMKVAQEILSVSPNAVREAKKLIAMNRDYTKEAEIQMDSVQFASLFEHPDSTIGIAAFIEKKKAVWKEEI